jgi:hypothetical protein
VLGHRSSECITREGMCKSVTVGDSVSVNVTGFWRSASVMPGGRSELRLLALASISWMAATPLPPPRKLAARDSGLFGLKGLPGGIRLPLFGPSPPPKRVLPRRADRPVAGSDDGDSSSASFFFSGLIGAGVLGDPGSESKWPGGSSSDATSAGGRRSSGSGVMFFPPTVTFTPNSGLRPRPPPALRPRAVPGWLPPRDAVEPTVFTMLWGAQR